MNMDMNKDTPPDRDMVAIRTDFFMLMPHKSYPDSATFSIPFDVLHFYLFFPSLNVHKDTVQGKKGPDEIRSKECLS
jgi:hypothetical protein